MLKNLNILEQQLGIKINKKSWNYRSTEIKKFYNSISNNQEFNNAPRYLNSSISEKLISNLENINSDSKVLVLFSVECIRQLISKFNLKEENIWFISDFKEKEEILNGLNINIINLPKDETYNINNIEKVLKDMNIKFAAAIGNPPYQEGKSKQIWPGFVNIATQIANETSLIHPGRWVVPKKNMKKVQEQLINNGLKTFDLYPKMGEVFEGVAVDSITITYFKNGYTGNINYNVSGKDNGIYSTDIKVLTNKYEEEIWSKLNPDIFGEKNMLERIIGHIGAFGAGDHGYNKTLYNDKLQENSNGLEEPIKIWANKTIGRSGAKFKWYYIERKYLNKKDADKALISRKVMLDKKGHSLSSAGKSGANIINNFPEIIDKLAIASTSLFVIPEIDNDYHLNLLVSLFKTKTARFLMSITQKDLYVRGFENIPDYTYFIKDLNGELFTDEFFYKKFNFSQELIDYIESHISAKH